MEWQIVDGKMEKTFKLKSFSALTEKLAELAKICDKINHHPDVSIFDYNSIKFSLITHSKGSITGKDHELAKEIDTIYQ